MTTWPILSVVTFLPVLGALVIYLSRGDDEAAQRNSRWIALWTTVVTFGISLNSRARMPKFFARTTTDRPSGVSSAREAS